MLRLLSVIWALIAYVAAQQGSILYDGGSSVRDQRKPLHKLISELPVNASNSPQEIVNYKRPSSYTSQQMVNGLRSSGPIQSPVYDRASAPTSPAYAWPISAQSEINQVHPLSRSILANNTDYHQADGEIPTRSIDFSELERNLNNSGPNSSLENDPNRITGKNDFSLYPQLVQTLGLNEPLVHPQLIYPDPHQDPLPGQYNPSSYLQTQPEPKPRLYDPSVYPQQDPTPGLNELSLYLPPDPLPGKYEPELTLNDTSLYPQAEPKLRLYDPSVYPQQDLTPGPYDPSSYPQAEPTPVLFDRSLYQQPDLTSSPDDPSIYPQPGMYDPSLYPQPHKTLETYNLLTNPHPYLSSQQQPSPETDSPLIYPQTHLAPLATHSPSTFQQPQPSLESKNPSTYPQPQFTHYDPSTYPQPQTTSKPNDPSTYPQPQSTLGIYDPSIYQQPQPTGPYDPSTYPQLQPTPGPYNPSTYSEPQPTLGPYDPLTYPQPQPTSGPYDPSTYPQPQPSSGLYETLTYPQPQPTAGPYDLSTYSQPQPTSGPYETSIYPQLQPTAGPYEPSTYPQPQPTSGPYETSTYTQPQPTAGPYYDPPTYPQPTSEPYETSIYKQPPPSLLSYDPSTNPQPTAGPSTYPQPQPPPDLAPSTQMPLQPSVIQNFTCAKKNGYHRIAEYCDAYVLCQASIPRQHVCPDGLLFNPAIQYPEYPCSYPSEVKCTEGTNIQPPKPTKECPRQYGYYSSADGECSRYIMCQEGKATMMHCPLGLVFNELWDSCDWPENVPLCNPNVFKNVSCPKLHDEDEKQNDQLYKYKYGAQCRYYIACQRGNPRLLSCDDGLSFDDKLHACVDSDFVQECL